MKNGQRILNNRLLQSTSARPTLDTLRVGTVLTFVKEIVPKPTATALYRLQASTEWRGQPVIAAEDATLAFVFFAINCHSERIFLQSQALVSNKKDSYGMTFLFFRCGSLFVANFFILFFCTLPPLRKLIAFISAICIRTRRFHGMRKPAPSSRRKHMLMLKTWRKPILWRSVITPTVCRWICALKSRKIFRPLTFPLLLSIFDKLFR